MRAVVIDHYGSPDELRLREVAAPVAVGDRVLVRVRATSINSWDWDLLVGNLQGRVGFRGFRSPAVAVLGADIAGQVVEVGDRVRRVRPGDEVMADVSGCGWGGLGEYVAVPEEVLAPKSPVLTFEQAAALPQAGLLALQGLRRGRLSSHQAVLVNGAGGGVGTLAVQMAKAAGAEVTGVDAAGKLEAIRAAGADQVIDYAVDDFTTAGQSYDLVLDVAARHTPRAYRRCLSRDGCCVVVGGSTVTVLRAAVFGRAAPRRRGHVVLLLHRPSADDLVELNRRVEADELRPVLDQTFDLAHAADAFRRFGSGQVIGKVVISV